MTAPALHRETARHAPRHVEETSRLPSHPGWRALGNAEPPDRSQTPITAGKEWRAVTPARRTAGRRGASCRKAPGCRAARCFTGRRRTAFWSDRNEEAGLGGGSQPHPATAAGVASPRHLGQGAGWLRLCYRRTGSGVASSVESVAWRPRGGAVARQSSSWIHAGAPLTKLDMRRNGIPCDPWRCRELTGPRRDGTPRLDRRRGADRAAAMARAASPLARSRGRLHAGANGVRTPRN